MTLVFRIYAIYCKYYGTARGLHSPNLYNQLLTNHSSRLSSFCKQKRNVLTNDSDFLTKYNPMKSYSILRNAENEVANNGTITRV